MSIFRKGEVPPHIIAMADQEMAAVEQLLDQLIAQWHKRQPEFDQHGFDPVQRVACFMVGDVQPCAVPRGIYAALTAAVVRLARQAENR